MISRPRHRLTILTTTLALAATEARAAGFYISDIGTRGMARAGAFVASPDSLLAMHYNPAGLSRVRGLSFEASVSLVQLDLQFTRSCPCVKSTTEGAAGYDQMLSAQFQPSNSNTPLGIPFLSIGYGLPFFDLTVAFAAWGPNSGRHDWGQLPETNFEAPASRLSQRYSALQVKNLEANYALGVAAAPIPVLEGLRVGANVMFFSSGADQTLNLWANSATFASSPEDSRFDVPLNFTFKKDFMLSWSVGASYEIIKGLNVGASYRPKREIDSEGSVIVRVPTLLREAGGSVTGQDITVQLQTAPILRVGVEYELENVFEAEAALVAEMWSVHNRIVITPKNITFKLGADEQQLAPIIVDRGWRDTYSVRVGGELKLFEPLLGLRGGYFFEPSAIPIDRVDPSRVDLDKHGVALGASTEFFGTTLEISAMYVFLASAVIEGSAVTQRAPLAEPLGSPELITTVGNGRYDGHYLIGSVSLSFSLDRLSKHL